MSQGDGLSLLQMSKSRHIGVHMLLHDGKQCLKHFLQKRVKLLRLLSDIKLHIKRHLVVAAPSCMQLFPGFSDPFCQCCLHKAVDILILL